MASRARPPLPPPRSSVPNATVRTPATPSVTSEPPAGTDGLLAALRLWADGRVGPAASQTMHLLREAPPLFPLRAGADAGAGASALGSATPGGSGHKIAGDGGEVQEEEAGEGAEAGDASTSSSAAALPEFDGGLGTSLFRSDLAALLLLHNLLTEAPGDVRAALVPEAAEAARAVAGGDSDALFERGEGVLRGATATLTRCCLQAATDLAMRDGDGGDNGGAVAEACRAAEACAEAARSDLSAAAGDAPAGDAARRLLAAALVLCSEVYAVARGAGGEERARACAEEAVDTAPGFAAGNVRLLWLRRADHLAEGDEARDSDWPARRLALMRRVVASEHCGAVGMLPALSAARGAPTEGDDLDEDAVAEDFRVDLAVMERCARLGDAWAMLELGRMLTRAGFEDMLKEWGGGRDVASYGAWNDWVRLAARNGSQEAMRVYALAMIDAAATRAADAESRAAAAEADDAAAEGVRWLHRAARRGDVASYCALAECYESGVGTAADRSRGFQLRLLGTQSGCTDCKRRVALSVMSGEISHPDLSPELAVSLLMEAAEEDDDVAMLRIGQLVAGGLLTDGSGEGGEESGDGDAAPQRPEEWFVAAAALGNAEAAFELALILKARERERGAAADAGEASGSGDRKEDADEEDYAPWRTYAQLAADGGFVPAMTFVGLRLLTGCRWERRDPGAATKFLARAAAAMDATAACALGICCANGAFGVARQPDLAKQCLRNAADGGSKRAQRHLKRLGEPRDDTHGSSEAESKGDEVATTTADAAAAGSWVDAAGEGSTAESDDEVWTAIEATAGHDTDVK